MNSSLDPLSQESAAARDWLQDQGYRAESSATSTSQETSLETLQTTAQLSFLGDTGKLPLDTRRVLVQLLTGPLIDGRRQGGRIARRGSVAQLHA
jgi:hypothetical protein